MPRPAPKRIFRTTNGAWDILSTPPVNVICVAPNWISWAPLTIAWNPEPHKRFTPSAGRSIGMPLNRAEWRGKKIPSDCDAYKQMKMPCNPIKMDATKKLNDTFIDTYNQHISNNHRINLIRSHASWFERCFACVRLQLCGCDIFKCTTKCTKCRSLCANNKNTFSNQLQI